MKKLSFALACIIGLMFFASCKKDTKLTITPIKTQGYVTNGTEVNIGETIQFGFDAEGTDLDVFSYVITAGDSSVGGEYFLEKQTEYSFTGNYETEISGTVTIVGTIKNAKGESETATITFTVKNNAITIAPISDEGFVSDGSEVLVYKSFKYGFDAYGTNLTHFSCTIESGGETTTEEIDLGNVINHTFIETLLPAVPGEVKITATINDAQGETATSSITVNVLETENYKFVGHYAGTLIGDPTIEIMGQAQEMGSIEYDAELEILFGENDDEVVAYYVLDGNEYQAKGSCSGNNVDFEPITVEYEELGNNMSIDINLSGVIEGSNLHITGNAEGEGEIVIPELPMPIPCIMHINFDGVMEKQ